MRVLLFLLGFFILANTYIFPWMSDSPRMTDIIGVISYVWLIRHVCKTGVSPVVATFSFIYLTPFAAWAVYSFLAGDMLSFVASIRWILALPIALAITESMKYFRKDSPLIYGMWFGCIINVLVMILQALNFHEFVQTIGLAPTDGSVRWVYGNYRSSGMYSHPNGSFAVLSMIIPISLYLYFNNKRNIAYLLIGIIIIFIGGELTYTRSPILVSMVVIMLAFILFKKQLFAWIVKLSPLLLSVVALIFIVGPPGGWERWTDSDNYSNNSSERIYSTIKSIEVMVDHPFGLGIQGTKEKVREYSGIGATHNAFTLVGGSFGIYIAFVLFMSFAMIITNMVLAKKLSASGLICVQVFFLFFFEEHLSNPFFIIISMWLLIGFVSNLSSSKEQEVNWTPKSSLHIAGSSNRKDISLF